MISKKEVMTRREVLGDGVKGLRKIVIAEKAFKAAAGVVFVAAASSCEQPTAPKKTEISKTPKTPDIKKTPTQYQQLLPEIEKILLYGGKTTFVQNSATYDKEFSMKSLKKAFVTLHDPRSQIQVTLIANLEESLPGGQGPDAINYVQLEYFDSRKNIAGSITFGQDVIGYGTQTIEDIKEVGLDNDTKTKWGNTRGINDFINEKPKMPRNNPNDLAYLITILPQLQFDQAGSQAAFKTLQQYDQGIQTVSSGTDLSQYKEMFTLVGKTLA